MPFLSKLHSLQLKEGIEGKEQKLLEATLDFTPRRAFVDPRGRPMQRMQVLNLKTAASQSSEEMPPLEKLVRCMGAGTKVIAGMQMSRGTIEQMAGSL